MHTEERLRRHFVGLQTDGDNLVVQFERAEESSSFHSSVQRFEAGRLVEWSLGTAPDANLTLQVRSGFEDFPFGLVHDEQLDAAKMATEEDGWTPLPPLDISQTCELPHIPGASVILQRTEVGPILGEVTYFEIFEDGQLMTRRSGSVKDPDVAVTMSYEQSLRWRAGNTDLLSSVKGAEIQGRRSHLMLLFGLLESHEYRDYASRHTGEINQLIALSSHYGSTAWQNAQKRARSDLLSESSS